MLRKKTEPLEKELNRRKLGMYISAIVIIIAIVAAAILCRVSVPSVVVATVPISIGDRPTTQTSIEKFRTMEIPASCSVEKESGIIPNTLAMKECIGGHFKTTVQSYAAISTKDLTK
jgi:hypothetical protein